MAASGKSAAAESAGQRARESDISFEESQAELESGDLFDDEGGDGGDESFIDAVAAVDDIAFEEDPPGDAVEAEVEAELAGLESAAAAASAAHDTFEADEVEAELARLESAVSEVSEPADVHTDQADPGPPAAVAVAEAVAVPVPSRAVDPGVSAAPERIAETGRSVSTIADAQAEPSTPQHLQIPDEFIAMDPEEARAISRRLAAGPPEPTPDLPIVQKIPESEVDLGRELQADTAAPAPRKTSRVGLVPVVGAGLVIAAVLVYMFAIRRPAVRASIPTAKPANAARAANAARVERPEPESGPIVLGRTMDPQSVPVVEKPPVVEAETAAPAVARAEPPPAAAGPTTPRRPTAKPRTTSPARQVEVAKPSPGKEGSPPPPANAALDGGTTKDLPKEAQQPAGTVLSEFTGLGRQDVRPEAGLTREPAVSSQPSNATGADAEPTPAPAVPKDPGPFRPALLPIVARQDPDPEPEPESSAARTGSAPVYLAPRLIEESRVEPSYPPTALRLRKQGEVLLTAMIAGDGSVKHVEVVSDSAPRMGFGDAAMKAVRRWKYEPARLDDKLVEASISVRIFFAP